MKPQEFTCPSCKKKRDSRFLTESGNCNPCVWFSICYKSILKDEFLEFILNEGKRLFASMTDEEITSMIGSGSMVGKSGFALPCDATRDYRLPKIILCALFEKNEMVASRFGSEATAKDVRKVARIRRSRP